MWNDSTIIVAVVELQKAILVVVLFETYDFDLIYQLHECFKCYAVDIWVLVC